MRSVLVTGAAGFAGRYLLEELALRGISTVGTYYQTPPPRNQRFRVDKWLRCDVRNLDAVQEVVASAKPEMIVHLAAMSVPAQANADPQAAYDTNVRGWLNVLEAARRLASSCRILLVSSPHVYGQAPTGSTGFHEELPVKPYDTYGATRATSEVMAEMYGRQAGLEVVVARPFNPCGPRQTPSHFIATLAYQLAQAVLGRGSPEVRLGNLEIVRDFTDIRDVVRAYVSLLRRGQSGRVYNVCSGKPVSLQTVVSLMREVSGCGFRVISDPDKTAGSQPSTVFGDPRRVQKETGWTPTIRFIDTLRDTFHYWKDRLGVGMKTTVTEAAGVFA